MKTLSVLAALLSLKALGVYGISCNTDEPLGPDDPSGDNLASTLPASLDDVCNDGFADLGSDAIIYNAGPLTFQISRSEDGKGATVAGDCKSAMNSIISQCLVTEKVWGGSLDVGGLSFEIVREDEELGLKARGKKTKSKKKKKKKPKTKTKTKKTKTKTKKTKTKTHHTKTKTTSTAACKTTQSKVKRGHGATKTSGAGCAATSSSCKKAYGLAKKQIKAESPNDGTIHAGKGLIGRDFYVGGMLGMELHEIKKRDDIQKRAPKRGVCNGVKWHAFNYPDAGSSKVADVDYYGWKQPQVCTNFDWGNPLKEAEVKKTEAEGEKYELEHVLEWQTVTGFFDWLNDDKKQGKIFPNPDPNKKDKVTFCDYFQGTWEMDNGEDKRDDADNPAAFALEKDGEERTPRQHLAAAYPSTQFHYDEFVYLEAEINAPAKAESFKYKPKDKKAKDLVFSKKVTAKNLKKVETAQTQLVKLKGLIGVRKYMRETEISETFKKQQVRIGETLDLLDDVLPNHPKTKKVKKKENGKDVEVDQANRPWEKQNLKEMWDEWMDIRFDEAVKRMDNEMRLGLADLDKKWGKDPNLGPGIKDITNAWATEKAIKWERPWPKANAASTSA
ncbi:hypothetical protein BJ875DRAFT_485120 [Amylocarpus encephaloides]|uniref:Uncharacterized protein n=1 Tax=Amylocarpus encephaloides TaxID=45428 RepID=A0A9P7YH93_9HELO|nr:hypothetical protein BJ875DRAFT_485120 [Amylocarpus encephaloides]